MKINEVGLHDAGLSIAFCRAGCRHDVSKPNIVWRNSQCNNERLHHMHVTPFLRTINCIRRRRANTIGIESCRTYEPSWHHNIESLRSPSSFSYIYLNPEGSVKKIWYPTTAACRSIRSRKIWRRVHILSTKWDENSRDSMGLRRYDDNEAEIFENRTKCLT